MRKKPGHEHKRGRAAAKGKKLEQKRIFLPNGTLRAAESGTEAEFGMGCVGSRMDGGGGKEETSSHIHTPVPKEETKDTCSMCCMQDEDTVCSNRSHLNKIIDNSEELQ